MTRLATLAGILTLALTGVAHAAPTAKLVQNGGPLAESSIIGGYYPDASQWPWMAAILDGTRGSNDKSRQFCGGALVQARLVVTAAHCMKGASASDLQVLLGKRRLSAPGGEHIQVSKIEVHPQFTNNSIPKHDVALLFLAAPSQQTPAKLIAPNTTLYQGNLTTTMGWGRRYSGASYDYSQQQSDDLKAIDQPLWSYTNCQNAGRDAQDAQYYRQIDPNLTICAGYSDISDTTCQGDSGSPMMIQDSAGEWRLLGVDSFGGIGCYGGMSPTAYAWLGGSLESFVTAGIAEAQRMPSGGGSNTGSGSGTVIRPRVRLSAALKRLSVRRGRNLKVSARSSAAGELDLQVIRRGRSLGTFAVDIDRGRNTVLQPTKVGHRKFKRGVYRLALRVHGRHGSSNLVKLGFRIR